MTQPPTSPTTNSPAGSTAASPVSMLSPMSPMSQTPSAPSPKSQTPSVQELPPPQLGVLFQTLRYVLNVFYIYIIPSKWPAICRHPWILPFLQFTEWPLCRRLQSLWCLRYVFHSPVFILWLKYVLMTLSRMLAVMPTIISAGRMQMLRCVTALSCMHYWWGQSPHRMSWQLQWPIWMICVRRCVTLMTWWGPAWRGELSWVQTVQ